MVRAHHRRPGAELRPAEEELLGRRRVRRALVAGDVAAERRDAREPDADADGDDGRHPVVDLEVGPLVAGPEDVRERRRPEPAGAHEQSRSTPSAAVALSSASRCACCQRSE